MKTGAERQAAYRARKGNRCGGKGGNDSKWATGEFIALDGEGENYGELEAFKVPKGGKTYHAQDHRYTLLAASTGESLYNGGSRLDTLACLDFLLDLSDAHTKAIFVIFAGSYDINHMLMFGFRKAALKEISSGISYSFKEENIEYQVEYRPRKSLTIRRGLTFFKDKNDKWKTKWASRIVIWDVFGFFQENFVGVMGKWLGKDHKHYDFIKEMKLKRGDFAHVSQSTINRYNACELECLVELMDKVKSAIDGLDLKVNRWDGAGAIAAALMRKHNIKDFKSPEIKFMTAAQDELDTAIATAYAGGRIEVCKIGVHNKKVYDYDINSAYPHVMASVPCLAHGQWSQGTGVPPGGFTLVHCRYRFAEGLPFYPLFYRTEAMQICFSSRGEGIYWLPEYAAALECPGDLEVIKWWHWEPSCNHKPFHWIEDYYKTRQRWVKNPLEEWQSGGEKIIKLGLNSLYGKSAQQLGGRADHAPAYHQLEWAGYITASTRARLYSAAMHNPDAVIGFATDGIFTTSPLPLQHSCDKTMGEWDVKEFDGLTLAMAGVYWWHRRDADIVNFSHFSRGFDKESMETPAPVTGAWQKGAECIDIKMRRLIGLGSACASETFFAMRGRFTEGMRTLALNGHSFKRLGIDVKKTKPHKNMVDTPPAMNIRYESELQGCSFPYPLVWQKNDEFQNELEQDAENSDTDNI